MSDLIDKLVNKIVDTMVAQIEGGKCHVRILDIKKFTDALKVGFKNALDNYTSALNGFSFTERYIWRLLDDHDFYNHFIATAATGLAERLTDGRGSSNSVKYFINALTEGYWYVLHELVCNRLGIDKADDMYDFFDSKWPVLKEDTDEYLRVKHGFIALFVEQLMWADNIETAMAIEKCLIEIRKDPTYATNMVGYVVNGKFPYNELLRSVVAHTLYYNNHR